MVQTMYFGYSVINDIFGSNSVPSKEQTNSNKSALQQFRDFIAASVVFPGSMVTAELLTLLVRFISWIICVSQLLRYFDGHE